MKHIILTRFNVMMPGWNSPVRLDSKWLEGRFELFESLCLPSVANQTTKDFEWFVYFDSQTPVEFKNKIESLKTRYPFKSLFVDIFDIKNISRHLSETFKSHSCILTSRLDSDDLLAKTYVEELHKIAFHSKAEKKSVINFDNGSILLQKGMKNYLYKYQDKSNPFAALVEPNTEPLLTILSVNHTTLHQHFDVINVTSSPMWLQVIHGGNVSNIVRGERVGITSFNHGFDYLRDISANTNESLISIQMDKFIFVYVRFLRDKVRFILKKIYYFLKEN